jgi:hypothetical protein
MTHYQNIPNWQLFKLKFEPTTQFIKQIEERFDVLKDTSEYKKVSKHINIQIGLLNLRDCEVRQEIMKEFIKIFQD